jgi:hypothetical protein
MIITFKSKGAGDVRMFGEHAGEILALVGKALDPQSAPRGIITAAEAPAALAQLRTALAASGGAPSAPAPAKDDADAASAVSLAQRAFPIVALLERAVAKKTDIVWGV